MPHSLESLVPPQDLCKQIPEGKFENSALVWTFDDRLMPRTIMIDGVRHYYRGFPAPTLQEILAEFNPPKYYGLQMVKLRSGVWQVLVCKDIWISKGVTRILCYGEDYSPVVAALKLYLNLSYDPSDKSVQSDPSVKSVSPEAQP